jgi:hypothetical protein
MAFTTLRGVEPFLGHTAENTLILERCNNWPMALAGPRGPYRKSSRAAEAIAALAASFQTAP